MTGLIIENLISVDDTGIPKAPKINQIIDKDVFLLYSSLSFAIEALIFVF